MRRTNQIVPGCVPFSSPLLERSSECLRCFRNFGLASLSVMKPCLFSPDLPKRAARSPTGCRTKPCPINPSWWRRSTRLAPFPICWSKTEVTCECCFSKAKNLWGPGESDSQYFSACSCPHQTHDPEYRVWNRDAVLQAPLLPASAVRIPPRSCVGRSGPR